MVKSNGITGDNVIIFHFEFIRSKPLDVPISLNNTESTIPLNT